MSNGRNITVDPPKAISYAGAAAYDSKAQLYFDGARRDYIAELPGDRNARILEIGCSGGETGAIALAEGKCGHYCGVEMFERAAEKARGKISHLLHGNIETLELPWDPETFDVLIMSEVLEHLADPWAVLRKLRPLLKPGARIFASSPNISHYRIIAMLIRGQWTLTDMGIMDRTHLRWFTPAAYRGLFESCDYRVDSVREHQPFSNKAKIVNALTFGQFKHLFMAQVDLRAHRP
jgi:2-polyprenyl-3-methyl-5-hydroxy-6-metoxy-1,4-benzoquinol methylase